MTSDRLLAGHLSVRLDAVLQTIELPAGVPHLDTSLANMDRDALALEERAAMSVRRLKTAVCPAFLKCFLNKESLKCLELLLSPRGLVLPNPELLLLLSLPTLGRQILNQSTSSSPRSLLLPSMIGQSLLDVPLSGVLPEVSAFPPLETRVSGQFIPHPE